jgi:hypothetical protein
MDSRCLVEILNKMYADDSPVIGNNLKSGRQKVKDNAISILNSAQIGRKDRIAKYPCLICTLSLDGRGRCQRSIRVESKKKINFRPWHITWIAANGPAPVGLQYSHRCHHENCVEPTHGVWEKDVENKSRNTCKNCSHVFLPDQSTKAIRLCFHSPCCLTSKDVSMNEFPKWIDISDLT